MKAAGLLIGIGAVAYAVAVAGGRWAARLVRGLWRD